MDKEKFKLLLQLTFYKLVVAILIIVILMLYHKL